MVEHAHDGVAALGSIAAEPPGLVLLELKLPGLHGMELIKKLRQSERTRDLPVIVMTGFYKGEKFRAAAIALGVRHYLEKPLTVAALLGVIPQELGSQILEPSVTSGESRPFAHQLRTAFLKPFSGLLTLKYPDALRMLTFINGAPVDLRPGYKSLDLGIFSAFAARSLMLNTTTSRPRHAIVTTAWCSSAACNTKTCCRPK